MRKMIEAALIAGSMLILSTSAVTGQAVKQQAELLKALGATHVPLAAGIRAAASVGTQLSAKYEYEHGTLQLSVYTARGEQFSEVVVDYATGKVAKTETITDGDDLKAARAQHAAAKMAKSSLADVVDSALAAHVGYSAVSATFTVKNRQPVAEIVLLKGSEFKSVSEPLAPHSPRRE